MWIDRRVLIGIAGASILLNVFLGGAVLGRAFGDHRRGAEAPKGVAAGPLVPPAHVQALPAEDRKRFRAAMASHRPAIRAARQAHREARRQIEDDIAAPVYDGSRIVADFKALRQTNRDTDEAVDAALIDALAQLPPESRAALVARGHPAKPGEPPPPR